MTLSRFVQLVELRTKLASLIPFLMGSLYAAFRFQAFGWINFMIMLCSLLAFDMATTVLNNYFDFKKAESRRGYGYEVHNPIVQGKLRESAVLCVLFGLLILAIGGGIALYVRTDLLVLLLGGLSFLVGILYSFGPIPISRMPLGELFSGLFMGFVIVFIAVYIHADEGQLAALSLQGGEVQLRLQLDELVLLFLTCLPAVFGIANIMLANNICDMEEDRENRRYTLPVYIGKRKALMLFRVLYYMAYLDLFVLLFLRVPIYLVLPMLLTLIPVHKNIRRFEAHPTKKDTFKLSVRNFMIINTARLAAFGLCLLLTIRF
ncbi:1,4-dihydroxy-2-naphthoate polyprenyltransferase [Paenibacillus sp. CAA11]|uniref:1,4-dihydroxy-2-naphthoate polyprenyltransferase n=1 Tax=Paenibacillus sp. CAA11 TaxID=1532905 RepID=UPI000D36E678|nr:1,4-dihydroxy-2-naphthoate polyprenyltransferase [Paenibacillus sp. CAA11]AWB46386.1 1,4-dihydroxy-2-naphthoate polyprenyltransferase [Paenibacillus sp. CAA11]